MKTFNTLLYTILLIAWFLTIYILYLLFYPFKTVAFNDPVFPVLTKEVKQGEVLIYKSDVCKYTDVRTTVARDFVNSLVYSTLSTVSTRPKGCEVDIIEIPIPEELPAGIYKLRTKFTYHINSIREISAIQESEEFEVVE